MGDVKNPPSGEVVVQTGSVIFDAADCAAASVTPQTVTIPGVAAGDGVLLIPPAAGLGVALAIGIGYGSAPNTAVVPFTNPSAGALNPGSLTYGYRVFKPAL
jgi:hypothetical protein